MTGEPPIGSVSQSVKLDNDYQIISHKSLLA